MTPEAEKLLIDRLLANQAAGRPDMADGEQELPIDRYVSTEHFGREWQGLFRGLPLVLGPVSAIAAPGDFKTYDDYGVPLLVTRGPDGVLQAFLNACTHRGARLVNEETGCGRHAFACPYHGWTFDNEGHLLHITRADCFPNTEKTSHGLVRFPVQERCGLIWVVLDPHATIDIDGFCDGLAPELQDLRLQDYVAMSPHDWHFPGNWKLLLENLLESYHLPFAHSALVNDVIGNMLVVDQMGRHQRLVLPRHTIEKLPAVDRNRWRLRSVASSSYFIFPNTYLSVLPDHMLLYTICPLSVDHSLFRLTVLHPATAQGDWWHETWARCREAAIRTLNEDLGLIGTIQAGLRAGPVPPFVAGRQELAIARFHEAIATTLTGIPSPLSPLS